MITVRLTPPLGNWLTTSSFKPALFLGVAATSSVALYTSTPSKESVNKVKETFDIVSKPLTPVIQEFTKGTSGLFEKLGDWAKVVTNQKDNAIKLIKETTKIDTVPEGAKQIFNLLKQWITKAYSFLAEHVPELIKSFSWTKTKELINQYGSLSKDILSFMSNIFKGGFDGNESMLAQLFKALGKPNFGEFLSATGELASKKGDVFREMDGKDFGDFVNAYNADPEGTTKIIKEFSDKPETEKVNKDTLMNALKPSALKERVQIAIAKAKEFTAKSHLSDKEKGEARKANENLKTLLNEIKQILGQHSRQIPSR